MRKWSVRHHVRQPGGGTVLMKWRPETDISGARSEPVTASTGKGSKVIGRQAVGTRGKICLSQGWQCPPSGWEITYIESYKSISCLYSSNNIYIYCFFFFFYVICNRTQPVGMWSLCFAGSDSANYLSIIQWAVIYEWVNEWVSTHNLFQFHVYAYTQWFKRVHGKQKPNGII